MRPFQDIGHASGSSELLEYDLSTGIQQYGERDRAVLAAERHGRIDFLVSGEKDRESDAIPSGNSFSMVAVVECDRYEPDPL